MPIFASPTYPASQTGGLLVKTQRARQTKLAAPILLCMLFCYESFASVAV